MWKRREQRQADRSPQAGGVASRWHTVTADVTATLPVGGRGCRCRWRILFVISCSIAISSHRVTICINRDIFPWNKNSTHSLWFYQRTTFSVIEINGLDRIFLSNRAHRPGARNDVTARKERERNMQKSNPDIASAWYMRGRATLYYPNH